MPEGTETPTTQAPAQEQIAGEQPSTTGETPTPSPAPVAAAAGALEGPQEQLEAQPADQITGEQLSPEVMEQIRQQLWPEHQSRADKQVAQRIREHEEKQAQEAEAKRLQALPGDQFKQAILQRQAVQQTQQVAVDQAQDRISAMYGNVTDDVLSVVPDPKKREELRARNDATFGGFVQAVVDAAVEAKLAKMRDNLQKTERTAAQKEARAGVGGAPQLGSGLPSSNVDNMDADEKIRYGLELAQREGG